MDDGRVDYVSVQGASVSVDDSRVVNVYVHEVQSLGYRVWMMVAWTIFLSTLFRDNG